jgi:hypothetical protein
LKEVAAVTGKSEIQKLKYIELRASDRPDQKAPLTKFDRIKNSKGPSAPLRGARVYPSHKG